MGFETRLLYGNNYQTSQPSGSFSFAAGLTGNPQAQSGTGSSYATFMLGAVSSATASTHIGESEKGYALAGYVQDEWRVSRRLAISMGLPSVPILPQGSLLGPSGFLGQGASYDQPNEKTPMSQQWNLSIQTQLPGKWVLELAYSGNHGTHLPSGGYDLNQLSPQQYQTLGTSLQNPVPNPYAGIVPGSLAGAPITLQQSLVAFPYYTRVSVRNPHLGDSSYHSGLVPVDTRCSSAPPFLASYT